MEGVRGIVVFALVGVFAASMIAAAAIDVRSRRFPNILAAFMSLVAVGLAWSLYSAPVFFTHVCCSIVFLCVLVGFELVWRRASGRSGLGMGDVKALAILALLSPLAAFAAFCISMLLLSIICLVRRLESLPLLPLLLPAFAFLVVICPSVWSSLDGSMVF